MQLPNQGEDANVAIGGEPLVPSHATPPPAAGDASEDTYALVNAQTGFSTSPNSSGYLVVGVFLAVAIAILLTVRQETDLRKLLAGLACVAAVNLVIAVFWAKRSVRAQ